MSANISLIQKWVENFVVGLNLCPFAKKPMEENLIHYTESQGSSDNEITTFFLKEIDFINKTTPEEISTSILIFPKLKSEFQNFYYLTQFFEDLLNELHLNQKFQIVCFHPSFIFEGLEFDDRANFVNRSPMPMIHILRAEEVAQAVKSLQAGENISITNEKKLNSLDLEEIHKLTKN